MILPIKLSIIKPFSDCLRNIFIYFSDYFSIVIDAKGNNNFFCLFLKVSVNKKPKIHRKSNILELRIFKFYTYIFMWYFSCLLQIYAQS